MHDLPSAPARRDLRLDVIRALALLTIFIDHVPGTLFERITMKNFGFADAAEVFVLISGMAVGLAYFSMLERGQHVLATVRIWKRAGVLYCTHIMTTVATLTIFCAASLWAVRPDLLMLNNINTLIDDPTEAFVGVGLLGHQLGYNNILSMYAVLMLAAPLMLVGAHRRPILTLAVSATVWLLAGIWQVAPVNYPNKGLWFLNPLSWQFLFVIGMVMTVQMRKGRVLPWDRRLGLLAGAYLLFAAVWIYSPAWGAISWFGLPPVIGGFDKTFLSLSRLLDILALCYLVGHSRTILRLCALPALRPLAVMGRYSLPVFIAGTVLAMVGQVVRMIYVPSLQLDATLIFTGIGLMFALAYYLQWLGGLNKPAGERPAREPLRQMLPAE